MVFCTRRRVLRPLSATMQSMNEAKTGRSWLTEAKQDISQWSASMPKNADNERIDWHWVMSLDLARHRSRQKPRHRPDRRSECRGYHVFVDLGENGSHAGFGTIRPTVA